MNISENFKGKTLVITGGTGSFGSTVLKHFISSDISEIRIISRDEKKQDWMRHTLQAQYPEYAGKVQFYVGDVRNIDSVRDVMFGADYVFHAAALKEVPSCEFFPMEAVRTNIIGTDNVITAAVENHVKRVVFLSTDKAAYPINTMGMTKAVGEHGACLYPVRQRHMQPRFGHPAVYQSNQKPSADHHHRSQHDAVFDEPGRGGRSRRFRL